MVLQCAALSFNMDELDDEEEDEDSDQEEEEEEVIPEAGPAKKKRLGK